MKMNKALVGKTMIDLTQLNAAEIAQIDRRQAFVCARCQKPVLLRRGARKKAHFAHLKIENHATNPESAAHRLVKECFAKWLKAQGLVHQVEARFSAVARIADVCFKYKTKTYVIEIQKSALSEGEFERRNRDYQRLGAAVIWVFLGDVKKRGATYQLPQVMQHRTLSKLRHFCVKSATVSIWEGPVYINSKEIYGQLVQKRLKEMRVEDFIVEKAQHPPLTIGWLEVKRNFRRRGWFYASKTERKLVEHCLLRGFNLAQLPVEVGWPVSGNAIGKPLFVWQAYVLMGTMLFFKDGAGFGLPDVLRILNTTYRLPRKEGMARQVKCYLHWLVKWEILTHHSGGYFEYRALPKLGLSVEASLEKEAKMLQIVRSGMVIDR